MFVLVKTVVSGVFVFLFSQCKVTMKPPVPQSPFLAIFCLSERGGEEEKTARKGGKEGA
jgi:hypothetical protein